jgi:hypothetical protein
MCLCICAPVIINMNIFKYPHDYHKYRYKRIKLDLLSRWEAINAGRSKSNGHKGSQKSTDKISKDSITTTSSALIYSALQEITANSTTTTIKSRYSLL